MTVDRAARLAVAGLFASMLVALPAAADAQVGTLAGKVVGPDGKPVADAEVNLTSPANSQTASAKTTANGEWVRAGLMTGNPWNIRVTKGDWEGGMNGVRVPFNSVLELPPIVIRPVAPPVDPATKARLEAEKAMQETLAKMGAEVDAAIAAGDFDLVIAKFTEAAATIPGCGVCYARIGDLHMKKKELAEAEKAYLRSVELDDQNPEVYSALASIYNQQRKFDEAAKMNAKVSSLSGVAGGGESAESLFNQGAIAFNQNKIAEAKPFLSKALALKPDLAEAHYLYGMVLINEGNVAEAKKSMGEYLRLAPTGPNAATAKAIIDTP
jgi:tetratricopeptide (TPR) repeat protein